jgi:hypothetical protein
VALVEGLGSVARHPVDAVLQSTGQRRIVFGRGDHEAVSRLQPPAKVLGTRRHPPRGLHIAVVGRRVELRHGGEVGDVAFRLDGRGGKSRQTCVQRVGAERRGEDQNADWMARAGLRRRGRRPSVLTRTTSFGYHPHRPPIFSSFSARPLGTRAKKRGAVRRPMPPAMPTSTDALVLLDEPTCFATAAQPSSVWPASRSRPCAECVAMWGHARQ